MFKITNEAAKRDLLLWPKFPTTDSYPKPSSNEYADYVCGPCPDDVIFHRNTTSPLDAQVVLSDDTDETMYGPTPPYIEAVLLDIFMFNEQQKPQQKCNEIFVYLIAKNIKTNTVFYIKVSGFRNIFYVGITPSLDNLTNSSVKLDRLQGQLNKMCHHTITNLKVVFRRLLLGYETNFERKMLKISTTSFRKIYDLRNFTHVLGAGVQFFEHDIPPQTKFLVNANLSVGRVFRLINFAYVEDGSMPGFHVDYSSGFDVCANSYGCEEFGRVGITGVVTQKLLNITVMSFDIECIIEAFGKCDDELILADKDSGSDTGEENEPPAKKQKRDTPGKVVQQPQMENVDLAERPGVVITITACCAHLNDPEKVLNVVFQLGTYQKIASENECTVNLAYETEEELLKGFSQFVYNYSPDIVTGYNITKFDYPFLRNRFRHYGIENEVFSMWSRVPSAVVAFKKERFESCQSGALVFDSVKIPGVLVYDMLPAIIRGFKLRQYSLNAVAKHFLKQTKDDVPYNMIKTLQEQSSATRAKIAKYCLQDSRLTLNLFFRLQLFHQHLTCAQMNGVHIYDLLYSGKEVLLTSYVYQYLYPRKIVFNQHKLSGACTPESSTYKGGHVFEPEIGTHKEEVIVLDLNSLYPSIMMCFNLCPSAYVDIREDIKEMLRAIVRVNSAKRRSQACTHDRGTPCGGLCDFIKEIKPKVHLLFEAMEGRPTTEENPDSPITRTSTGHSFMNHFMGIFPILLTKLLKQRAETRQLQKKAPSVAEYQSLDHQQLNFKAIANSMYGVLGSNTSRFYSPAISASVTGYGRVIIQYARDIIHAPNTDLRALGLDLHVVYGDTDSIMIRARTRKSLLHLQSLQDMPEEAAAVRSMSTDIGKAVKCIYVNCIAEERVTCAATPSAAADDLVATLAGLEITKTLVLDIATRIGPVLADWVTASIGLRFIKFAFEKTFHPFLLVAKKKYAGMAYETKDKKAFGSKGLETVRRDNALISPELLQRVLEMFVEEETTLADIAGYMKENVNQVFRGEVDLSKLVESKAVTKTQYKNIPTTATENMHDTSIPAHV